MLSWNRFFQQFKEDLKLWIYFVFLQSALRVGFIVTLSDFINDNTTQLEILEALVHGLRFDSLWATVWTFIPLCLITLPSFLYYQNQHPGNITSRFRKIWAALFTLITTLIYLISIQYYQEYRDIFNQFIFGLIYDDTIAILKTIYAEYSLFTNLGILCFIFLIYLLCFQRWFHIGNPPQKRLFLGPGQQKTFFQKSILSIFIVCFYVIGFRGSTGNRPIQLKDAGVTTDPFLNKAIVSPYSALRYAFKEQKHIQNGEKGLAYITQGENDILALTKSFFKTQKEYKKLSSYLKKTAKGSRLKKPKHIFLIIGESLDAWPLEKAYHDFKLTPNLKKLMRKGLYLKAFLPISEGTGETLSSIITGLPELNLKTNYQLNSYKPYPCALASQFKRLGFVPQFFYGGYLSWERIEDFVRQQDFQNVFGAAHIQSWQHTNEWGVDDRALLQFITKTIQKNKAPTFNVIMTTSNHPPFGIDLKKEGFHEDHVNKILKKHHKTQTNVRKLGHIWYADQTIGEFVSQISKQFPNSLFVITGDHFGRKHLLPNPSLFETSAVPLILYGNNVQKHYQFPKQAAGSHLDLGATLIELVAPKGFEYYAMGKNLFDPSEKNKMGIGYYRIITSEFIARTGDQSAQTLDGRNKVSNANLKKLKILHDQAHGIAWWMIKKGDYI